MKNHLRLWTMGGLLALLVIIAKQLSLVGVHPVHLAMMQAFGSIAFLSAFGIKGLISSLRNEYRYYFIASMLGFTIPQLVVFYSVEHVGSSVAALAYAFPLFITYFLSQFTTRTPLNLKCLLYLAGAFSGSILFLYKPDVLDFDSEQLRWLVLLGISPIMIGAANVYRGKYFPAGVPVFHVALLTNVFSLLTYMLITLLLAPSLPDAKKFESNQFGLLISFMVVAALGQYLLFSLQKTAEPSFIGQTGSITALLGGILGFVFFRESYELNTLVGSLLIVIGVAGFSSQHANNTRQYKQTECQTSNQEKAL